MAGIAYLGLGTNIGNKRRNLITAAAMLAERAGDVLTLSRFYESEPWGFKSENLFLNAALKLRTELAPLELLSVSKQIEKEMGRTEKTCGEYHDRIIDIDILLYDSLIMKDAGLLIPHPLMTERKFVMEPLAEIAPAFIHPVLKLTMAELNEKL
jgi:2-amino-4-hydroxy-6-hydroxymethyldihydropteridine diphosphokinase